MGTRVHDDSLTPILPLTPFGSFAWYKELVAHKHVLIETKEHFPKQSFRNRYEILTSNGILSLSIPVRKPHGGSTPYEEILIDLSSWKGNHWRSIQNAYASSPYFDHYEADIRKLIYEPEELLYRFNLRFLDLIINWLELPVTYDLTSEFMHYHTADLRVDLASKHLSDLASPAPYIQCFPGDATFNQRISLLDGLFCEGPLIRKQLIP